MSRDEFRNYYRDWKANKRAQALCWECNRVPVVPGMSRCQPCRELRRQQDEARRRARGQRPMAEFRSDQKARKALRLEVRRAEREQRKPRRVLPQPKPKGRPGRKPMGIESVGVVNRLLRMAAGAKGRVSWLELSSGASNT